MASCGEEGERERVEEPQNSFGVGKKSHNFVEGVY
jgi:hypothetical protein